MIRKVTRAIIPTSRSKCQYNASLPQEYESHLDRVSTGSGSDLVWC